MKTKKTPFFIRLKDSIINFDEYKNFLEEKTWVAIKYILKLVFIFTLVVTIGLTYKLTNEVNKIIIDFKNECPEFNFQNNTLILEGDNKRIIKGDETGYFGFIIDDNEENLSAIEEAGDYQRVIAILRDKIIVKSVDNIESSTTYQQLSQSYDLNSINKSSILQFLTRK